MTHSTTMHLSENVNVATKTRLPHPLTTHAFIMDNVILILNNKPHPLPKTRTTKQETRAPVVSVPLKNLNLIVLIVMRMIGSLLLSYNFFPLINIITIHCTLYSYPLCSYYYYHYHYSYYYYHYHYSYYYFQYYYNYYYHYWYHYHHCYYLFFRFSVIILIIIGINFLVFCMHLVVYYH